MRNKVDCHGCGVIYQTRETVFHRYIQALRRDLKIRRTVGCSGVFLTKFEVFG